MTRPLDKDHIDQGVSRILGKTVRFEVHLKDGVAYFMWVDGYPLRFLLTDRALAKTGGRSHPVDYEGINSDIAELIRPHLERYDREKSERTT